MVWAATLILVSLSLSSGEWKNFGWWGQLEAMQELPRAHSLLVTSFVEQTKLIDYDTLSIDCMDYRLQKATLIIQGQEDFEKLNAFRRGPECDPLPQIDFDDKILLAYNVEATGCKPPKCTARIEDVNGEYIVYLTFTTDGGCRMLFRKVFWFLIQKPNIPVNIRFQLLK
jgi:hypothetical protein